MKTDKENITNKIQGVDTREGKLILDSHKLSYHYDRVESWANGDKIAPISVDMALTRACGAMCSFCYAMVQEPQERASIKTKNALDLLDDFREIGVKGDSLISDGESTLSKAYVPFIQHASKIGIDVGNATNGWEWEKEKIDQDREYRETMQEVMLDLKLRTNELMEKLKEQVKRDRVRM